MITIIAAALAAAAPAQPAPDAHGQHGQHQQQGQNAQHECCCKNMKGKMHQGMNDDGESRKTGAPEHKGHSGH